MEIRTARLRSVSRRIYMTAWIGRRWTTRRSSLSRVASRMAAFRCELKSFNVHPVSISSVTDLSPRESSQTLDGFILSSVFCDDLLQFLPITIVIGHHTNSRYLIVSMFHCIIFQVRYKMLSFTEEHSIGVLQAKGHGSSLTAPAQHASIERKASTLGTCPRLIS
jgi:hypothetical protein